MPRFRGILWRPQGRVCRRRNRVKTWEAVELWPACESVRAVHISVASCPMEPPWGGKSAKICPRTAEFSPRPSRPDSLLEPEAELDAVGARRQVLGREYHAAVGQQRAPGSAALDPAVGDVLHVGVDVPLVVGLGVTQREIAAGVGFLLVAVAEIEPAEPLGALVLRTHAGREATAVAQHEVVLVDRGERQ